MAEGTTRTARVDVARGVDAAPGVDAAREVAAAPGVDAAREVAAATPDPELPVVTIGELGILRSVERAGDTLVVTLTPTYSGCPAMREISADVEHRLRAAGHGRVEVRAVLAPAWSTDWITAGGRAKLAAAGIAPPGPAPRRGGPVPLRLGPRPSVGCPRCGSPQTVETAAHGATACTSLHRCLACAEPFEAVRPL